MAKKIEHSGDTVVAFYQQHNKGAIKNRYLRNLRVIPKNLSLWRLRKSGGRRDVVLRFPWGEFNGILPEHVSSTAWKYGAYDSSVATLLAHICRPGDVLCDVGAHFGYFTVMGAYLVGMGGEVHSFEATPSTYSQLKKNTANLTNVVVTNSALSDIEGVIRFNDFGVVNSSLNTSGKSRTKDIEGNAIDIPCSTIDLYVEQANMKKIDVMKLDVESMESMVLAGGRETFRQHKPSTIVEIGAKNSEEMKNVDGIHEFFQSLGYEKYNSELNKVDISISDYSYGNYLFLSPDRNIILPRIDV